MFAQSLFLARVQFTLHEPVRHLRAAKKACHDDIVERCSFRGKALGSATAAREIENRLKRERKPALNATEVSVDESDS